MSGKRRDDAGPPPGAKVRQLEAEQLEDARWQVACVLCPPTAAVAVRCVDLEQAMDSICAHMDEEHSGKAPS